MALISIGGNNLPTPADYQVGYQDISKAERNANGLMLIQRIATKRTIDLSYSYLDQATISNILSWISPVSFSVTYLDPQTNSTLTSNFYSGDRTLGMIDYVSGVPRYKDLKFKLIEL